MHCLTLPRLGLPRKPAVAPLWTYVVSGACFTGLVLYILFALSYYALIKAILSLQLGTLILIRVSTKNAHGCWEI